ncbi:Na(+)/H(+) antiporter subunit G [Corynebacterium ciconiae DSM 44920]|uniref:monovalent cation/H(+) antiporter subunit G n=1 Tax=Corynebacterium ciconiae TaxID=227319 RepID=UPI00035EF804|nr:monovalent cation/H(+) antiporter subunit G [Corynebacterium ciconiae]WKD61988.1 Na(+)/H(+) antiporter subunit G [Corynebacterium ciconiae DSM 44920]
MTSALLIASFICLTFGALLSLSASLGLARFHGTMQRLHAITKPQTLGLVLVVLGAILRVIAIEDFGSSERGDITAMVLVMFFALLTAPVVAQRFGRIARQEKLYDAERVTRDEPAEKQRKAREKEQRQQKEEQRRRKEQTQGGYGRPR